MSFGKGKVNLTVSKRTLTLFVAVLMLLPWLTQPIIATGQTSLLLATPFDGTICNNGHGEYVSGICYTGKVTVKVFDGKSHPVFHDNPLNMHDPLNGQCVANCVITKSFTVYNLLTNQGKNMVKSNLGALGGNSNQSAPIIITLANTSFTAAAGDNSCCGGTNYTEVGGSVGTSSGLDPSSGSGSTSVTSTGTGTWTVVKTFTLAAGYGGSNPTVYGASLETKCCGSTTTYSGAGSVRNTQPNPTGYTFADALFSSSVVLAPSDSVQVTWSCTAS